MRHAGPRHVLRAARCAAATESLANDEIVPSAPRASHTLRPCRVPCGESEVRHVVRFCVPDHGDHSLDDDAAKALQRETARGARP
jgi:hypothetical protein